MNVRGWLRYMKRFNETVVTALGPLTMCLLLSGEPGVAATSPAASPVPVPRQSANPSPAATTTPSAAPSPSASVSPDNEFVQTAMQTELGLYGLASLAEKKAADIKLKQLAKDLKKSTNDAYRFLDSYAKKHSMVFQKKPELRAAAQYSELLALSGKDFDRQFGKSLYIDANINLDTFSQQATQGKDSALRAFSKRQLTQLKRLAKATDQYKGS